MSSDVMTLGWMRAHGITCVDVFCRCGAERLAYPADRWPDDLPLPGLELRFRCVACGGRPYEVRPDWSQHRASGVVRDPR